MIDFTNIPSECPHCGEPLILTTDYATNGHSGTAYTQDLVCNNSDCNAGYSYYIGITTEEEEIEEHVQIMQTYKK